MDKSTTTTKEAMSPMISPELSWENIRDTLSSNTLGSSSKMVAFSTSKKIINYLKIASYRGVKPSNTIDNSGNTAKTLSL